MSSHHIVREKQEPALLLLGLKDFSFELLGQLLEWSPTVIATGQTIAQLNANQIKVDWLFTPNDAGEVQSHIKTIAVDDGNVFIAAMNKLIEEGYPAVNIVTDEIMREDYLAMADKIDMVIYKADKKIYPVKSSFDKWVPAGELIEIMGAPQEFTYTGLKPISANKYETVADGFFSLQFKQPYILIAETIS